MSRNPDREHGNSQFSLQAGQAIGRLWLSPSWIQLSCACVGESTDRKNCRNQRIKHVGLSPCVTVGRLTKQAKYKSIVHKRTWPIFVLTDRFC